MSNAVCGFVYAKLSDLPPTQVAMALIIWKITETFIQSIVGTFTENKLARGVIKVTVLTATTIVGLQAMKQRGLIGPKLTNFFIACRTFEALRFLDIDHLIYLCLSRALASDEVKT